MAEEQMPWEEQRALFQELATLPEAAERAVEIRKRLAEVNLRMVGSFIRDRAKGLVEGPRGLEHKLELVGRLQLKLTELIARFNVSLGYKFSTFAYLCFRHVISDYARELKKLPRSVRPSSRWDEADEDWWESCVPDEYSAEQARSEPLDFADILRNLTGEEQEGESSLDVRDTVYRWLVKGWNKLSPYERRLVLNLPKAASRPLYERTHRVPLTEVGVYRRRICWLELDQ